MFIPMMESSDQRSDPRQLSSFHSDRQGISLPPTATGSTEPTYAPLHYVSPSEVPFYYPKAGPSPVQALPMFPGRSGGTGYSLDHNKRSRDGTSSAPPSISTPQFNTHVSQIQELPPPSTDNNPNPVAHAQQQQQQQQQPSKRSRLATYTPPRNPTKNANLLAAMGSLAAGAATAAAAEQPKNSGAASSVGGMVRVPFRRQLSGSRLEGFLGNHDSMDVDESGGAESRPRSMSF
jgi:hypothetical protein